jgi:hypothetical protein
VHPGGFDGLLPATLATAAVDRFMHHAQIVPRLTVVRRQRRNPAGPIDEGERAKTRHRLVRERCRNLLRSQ